MGRGGVVPTMNSFDNGDSRATTIIIMRNREGKPGGGKGPMLGEKSFTLATNNDQVLFEPTTIVFKPHQQDGARIQDDVINTLTAQMGTGGNNVPMVAYSIDSEGSNSMKSKNPNSGSNEVTIANTITTITPDPSDYRGGNAIVNNNSKQVRRLTPKECERLQGFPDGWTVSQSDSARYKQMGNAVAVPVVDWLIKGFIN